MLLVGVVDLELLAGHLVLGQGEEKTLCGTLNDPCVGATLERTTCLLEKGRTSWLGLS